MVSLTRVGLSSSTSVFTAASLPGRLRSARHGRAGAASLAGAASGGYGGPVYGRPAPWPATTDRVRPRRPGSGRSVRLSFHRQGIALGGRLFRPAGQPADQADDDDGDDGTDDRAEHVDPPA